MRNKRKAHEETMEECSAPMIREDKFRAGAKLHHLKTAGDEAWDEVKTAFRIASAKLRFRATGHAANGHARRLAEAIILQSIEDLWNPVCKKGSLKFFEGDGFALCSEIAGISYIKQLAILRTLAYAGKKKLHNTRKLSEGALTGG